MRAPDPSGTVSRSRDVAGSADGNLDHASYTVSEGHRSYARGCRCADCRTNHRVYMQHYRSKGSAPKRTRKRDRRREAARRRAATALTKICPTTFERLLAEELERS